MNSPKLVLIATVDGQHWWREPVWKDGARPDGRPRQGDLWILPDPDRFMVKRLMFGGWSKPYEMNVTPRSLYTTDEAKYPLTKIDVVQKAMDAPTHSRLTTEDINTKGTS